MIEYLIAPPVAAITTGSFMVGFFLVAIILFSVIVLIASIAEKDPWYVPMISFVIWSLAVGAIYSGVYESHEPLPEHSKETCVLVEESVGVTKQYKSTTVNAVPFKTYKNINNDESFSIQASHGKVYPKEIVCYRVVRSNQH